MIMTVIKTVSKKEPRLSLPKRRETTAIRYPIRSCTKTSLVTSELVGVNPSVSGSRSNHSCFAGFLRLVESTELGKLGKYRVKSALYTLVQG